MRCFQIIFTFLLLITSCKKEDASMRCIVKFESKDSIERVSYVFRGIDYRKFNAVGKIISSGKLQKITPFQFELDTLIKSNEISGLTVSSLLLSDTIKESQYHLTMALNSIENIVYIKSFKENRYTNTFFEF